MTDKIEHGYICTKCQLPIADKPYSTCDKCSQPTPNGSATLTTSKDMRTELVEWIISYKDVAERNALAETPDESADYLMLDIIEPAIEQAKKEERIKIGEWLEKYTHINDYEYIDQLKQGKPLKGNSCKNQK
jgi:hypothetical protein